MARVQYREVQCKSALNRVRGMPFKWSLNTYRGCAHACHYCYARASHAYYGLNAGEDFETKIFVKVNVADVLRRELARPSWLGEQVALGTITDCYQPAEGRFRVTRGVLEALLARLEHFPVRWLSRVSTDTTGALRGKTGAKVADPSGNVLEFKTYDDPTAALGRP